MSRHNADCFFGALSGIISQTGLQLEPHETERAAPLAVFFPENMEQVRQIILAAGKYKIPLVPVSSAPVCADAGARGSGDAVVVDFSRMKKIYKIDALSRYAWIEPGVTFGALIPALKEQGMRLNMPLLPNPGKSVVASLLEREPVIIPKYQYDYVDPLLTLEVVYGTGDDFRTGSASGPGPIETLKADKVNPWGPGAVDYMRFLTGAQGTMGFVTWAVVKTEILPSLRKLFFVSGSNPKPLTTLINTLLAKRVPDECLLLNNVELAALLSENDTEYGVLKAALPRWTLITCIAGYDRYPEERVRIQEKYLYEIAAGIGLKPETALPSAGSKTALLSDRLTGCRDNTACRNSFEIGCRSIFFLTPISRAAGFTDMMSQAAGDAGFAEERLGIYIQPLVQGRGCHVEFSLYYDEADPAEKSVADRLFTLASETLMDSGAFFSRPYGEWADMVYGRCGESVAALKKLKSIFDPDNILNPGILCF